MAKLVQLAAASSYAATSVLILLFNKVILSSYSFKYPLTMTLCHMLMGLFFLNLLRAAKMINYATFDVNLARKVVPVCMCFIANVVLGMVALRGTNIPMFATLRRLTVMMVVLCEVLILRKKQTRLVVGSVVIMILGSFIGGWGDLQFDLFGYCMVLLNNLVTALNLVFIKKTLLDTKLASDTFGVLYYNSLLSIPVLAFLALIFGEVSALPSFPFWGDVYFQFSFIASAVMSFLMNYSTYWCTEVNSALTTSVTGQVKNVLSSFVALSMFGMRATPLLVLGLTVGLMGSMLYAYAVYKKDQKNRASASHTNGSVSAVNSKEPGTDIPLLSLEKDEHVVCDGLSGNEGGVRDMASKAHERFQHARGMGLSIGSMNGHASPMTNSGASSPVDSGATIGATVHTITISEQHPRLDRRTTWDGVTTTKSVNAANGTSAMNEEHDTKIHRMESGQLSPSSSNSSSSSSSASSTSRDRLSGSRSPGRMSGPLILTPTRVHPAPVSNGNSDAGSGSGSDSGRNNVTSSMSSPPTHGTSGGGGSNGGMSMGVGALAKVVEIGRAFIHVHGNGYVNVNGNGSNGTTVPVAASLSSSSSANPTPSGHRSDSPPSYAALLKSKPN